jgi:hypothetical protein
MRIVLALLLALEPEPTEVEPAESDPEAPPADPGPAHTDAATLFQLGHYREAAESFAREYEATPDPALLFGRAVALKRSGDCLSAIDAFEVFIAAGPPASDVAEAERQVYECRAIVSATAAAAAPAPQREPVAPPPAPDDDRVHASHGQWYRDPLGGVLVGVGVPVLVAGVGLYAGSFVLAGRPRPDMQSEHESRRDRVRALAGTGLPLCAVGAALVIAGAIRWGIVARRHRAADPVSLDSNGLRFSF